MKNQLWRFTDNLGSFESKAANKIKSLYFPLANETLMSSVTPDLHGDSKTSQKEFLLAPVSRIGLIDSKSSRNFWLYFEKGLVWSATGVSKDILQVEKNIFKLNAGLLWHQIENENKAIGVKAEILSFIPAGHEPIEVMQVKLTNISSKKIRFIPTAAIPIYARGADNLRDHRHVTSLLQQITVNKFGVTVKPALTFNELGHSPNNTNYFVWGFDEKLNPAQYIYPTQEMFCTEEQDLEAPGAILKNIPPTKKQIQGKEAMGALRFRQIILTPKGSYTYIVIMGITDSASEIKKLASNFNSPKKVIDKFKETKEYWVSCSEQINICTETPDFDNWFRWVSIQPALRRIFGCSFLPDFDYGKGGRGWRDLWQDCLGLILGDPEQVRGMLINNFSGVRIDGSNATIIGKGPGEFISDRNNISRVWADHGMWPLVTLELYINETGDFNLLFEEVAYFRNHEVKRSREIDRNWRPSYGNNLKDTFGNIYRATIIEHLLVQNLVQFFNVGEHNYVRLEGADWNDGLDMAPEKGESVAFSAMYAQNLLILASLLSKLGRERIQLAEEIGIILGRPDYNNVAQKQVVLEDYFEKTKTVVSGKKVEIEISALADNLKEKAEWLKEHIRKQEWLKEGFFNGYYDNLCQRVEGKTGNLVKMILSSQVFPVMSQTAQSSQIKEILKNVSKYLFDKKLKGYHLNTNFKQEQHNLGRAFSFVYGDKENGAFFNHMVVMFAYGLYKCGFVKEGWDVLSSIYEMAIDTQKSKIYPCLPEYFDAEGRGMYLYLTGSASWFVLTMLTQSFGVKGQDGDLLIEPKLCMEQFKKCGVITVNRAFAARRLKISFLNPKKLEYGKYKIIKAALNSQAIQSHEPQSILIKRTAILDLPKDKAHSLNIELG